MSHLDSVVSAIVDGDPIDWQASSRDLPPADRESLAALNELFAVFRNLHEQEEHRTTEQPHASMWGPLYLHEPIGGGASSVVYRATDPKLDRQVALKLLTGVIDLPENVASTTGAQVVHEGRLVARVRHPNIVTVLGADVVEGTPGIWMELIDGRTLSAELAERGPFSAREAALIGSEVCAALVALHRAGLIHRDIKPQNIMRERGGRTVLMDLSAGLESGTAITASGPWRLAGTPLYMAPELFTGSAPSVASDVYAVGALLYYLTTSSHPVVAASVQDLKANHATGRRRLLSDARSGLDARFVAIIESALDADPARRPQSAGDLQGRLTEYLSDRAPLRSGWATMPVAIAVVGALGAGIALGAGWIPRTGNTGTLATSSDPLAVSRRGVAVYVPEHLDAAAAFDDLAAVATRDGRMSDARDSYEAARRIYAAGRGPDTPAAAVSIARTGWAQFQARKFAEARGSYQLALIKLEQELGAEHPLVISTLAAMAVLEQHDRRFDAAATTFERALLAHRRMLARLTNRDPGPVRLTISSAALSHVLSAAAIDADADLDGLSDAVEAMLGTSPRGSVPNRSRFADAEGDADGDGWPDGLEFGIAWDPSGVLALTGSHDPLDLAYRTSRPAESRPSDDGLGWILRAPQQAHYFRRFTSVNLERAAARGFRVTWIGRAKTGGAFFNLDLGPALGRFDLHLHAGSPPFVQFQNSVVPLAGPQFALGADAWSVLQLIYDPATATASFWIDGKKKDDGLRGHHQFLEGYGFILGADNELGRAPAGENEFRLAVVDIR